MPESFGRPETARAAERRSASQWSLRPVVEPRLGGVRQTRRCAGRQGLAHRQGVSVESKAVQRLSDRLTFAWLGACPCGRVRRTHVVRAPSGGLDVVGRCDAGHETDLADVLPAGAGPDAEPHRRPDPHPFDDSTVLIALIRAHLDAIARFVDRHAERDRHHTSPQDRGRLVAVESLVNQALERFS
jgi:hypothetical protein